MALFKSGTSSEAIKERIENFDTETEQLSRQAEAARQEAVDLETQAAVGEGDPAAATKARNKARDLKERMDSRPELRERLVRELEDAKRKERAAELENLAKSSRKHEKQVADLSEKLVEQLTAVLETVAAIEVARKGVKTVRGEDAVHGPRLRGIVEKYFPGALLAAEREGTLDHRLVKELTDRVRAHAQTLQGQTDRWLESRLGDRKVG